LNDGDVVQVGQHEIMYIDERSPRLRNTLDPADTGLVAGIVTGVVDMPKPS